MKQNDTTTPLAASRSVPAGAEAQPRQEEPSSTGFSLNYGDDESEPSLRSPYQELERALSGLRLPDGTPLRHRSLKTSVASPLRKRPHVPGVVKTRRNKAEKRRGAPPGTDYSDRINFTYTTLPTTLEEMKKAELEESIDRLSEHPLFNAGVEDNTRSAPREGCGLELLIVLLVVIGVFAFMILLAIILN